MILVALGTQKFSMERLVKAVDELAPSLGDEVFIQIGNTRYEPKNCTYQDFIGGDEFQQKVEQCSLLITHSGVGTIMRGINAGKPVVVFPRLAKYREHVDDHQVQIAEAFAGKGCVLYCENEEQLPEILEKAKTFAFQPYEPPKSNIEDMIFDFIEKM